MPWEFSESEISLLASERTGHVHLSLDLFQFVSFAINGIQTISWLIEHIQFFINLLKLIIK